LLPLASHTLPLALTGLFVVFLTFEFTIVTGLSLFTEILPGARATMMSSNVAAIRHRTGDWRFYRRPVWLAAGCWTGLVSAAICVLALACLAWGCGTEI
jgi:Ni,Fe-hydrogenase I cytochrome b subunit